MSVAIRSESPFDVAAIDALPTSHTEQLIVRALRGAKQLSVSLVAENKGNLVGHVAVSPVSISDGTQHWYGLGPISVARVMATSGIWLATYATGFDGVTEAGCCRLCRVW